MHLLGSRRVQLKLRIRDEYSVQKKLQAAHPQNKTNDHRTQGKLHVQDSQLGGQVAGQLRPHYFQRIPKRLRVLQGHNREAGRFGDL